MWRLTSLPYLTVSDRGCNGDAACHEQAAASRTRLATKPSDTHVHIKLSKKLTAANSYSNEVRIAEDEPVTGYYRPQAFEELQELEGAA